MTLDAAWAELVADALASDGPIRDSDVKDAVRRNRPRIEREAGPLDAAWFEVQAALPMAGWVDPLDGRWVIPTGAWSIDIRRAESGDGYFEPAVEGFWATAKVESTSRPFAVRGDLGPTPAAALRSLAARLREVQP